MNPFLDDSENGISFIDRYFEFLERRVGALLPLQTPIDDVDIHYNQSITSTT